MQLAPHGTREYASTLARLEPTTTLDARIDSLIRDTARARRPARWQSVPDIRLLAAVAGIAGVLLFVTYAVAFLMPADREGTVPPPAPSLVAGYADAVPVDAIVMRVPTGFSATAVPAVASDTSELRYWVDVRIASDGSMRVVRVIPAEMASD
jgi:hypothetical protein